MIAREEDNQRLLIIPLIKGFSISNSTFPFFSQSNKTLLCTNAYSRATLKFGKAFIHEQSNLFIHNFLIYFRQILKIMIDV